MNESRFLVGPQQSYLASAADLNRTTSPVTPIVTAYRALLDAHLLCCAVGGRLQGGSGRLQDRRREGRIRADFRASNFWTPIFCAVAYGRRLAS
jgi:hypothetical protein